MAEYIIISSKNVQLDISSEPIFGHFKQNTMHFYFELSNYSFRNFISCVRHNTISPSLKCYKSILLDYITVTVVCKTLTEAEIQFFFKKNGPRFRIALNFSEPNTQNPKETDHHREFPWAACNGASQVVGYISSRKKERVCGLQLNWCFPCAGSRAWLAAPLP